MPIKIPNYFQAEDGIRDLVRSRGLGDVYKRQHNGGAQSACGRGHGRRDDSDAGGDAGGHSGSQGCMSLIHI